MDSFYTQVIQKDRRYLSPNSCGDVNLLEPRTREVALVIILDAKQTYNIQLEILETYRSQERQASLYAQGATKLKDVGVHHYGLACDFVKVIGGQLSWKGDWVFLRDLASNYGFITGYDWGEPTKPHSFVDPGHMQRIATKDQEKLFGGLWYPDDSYVITASTESIT